MPTWWPFGRKRRKNKKAHDAEKLTSDKSLAPNRSSPRSKPPPPPPPPRLDKRAPADPEKPPPEPAQVQSSPPQSLREPDASDEELTALPISRHKDRQDSPHLHAVSGFGGQIRPQSVQSKRSSIREGSLIGRKSSKRMADKKRESQIKAMSSPINIPKRPGAEYGGGSRRGSRHTHGNVGDDSVVSLPHAGSVRSANTQVSDNHYEVGKFSVFAARPQIRHSLQSPTSLGALRSTANSRNDSRWEGEPSYKRELRERKTIDDLADNYDTQTLRELMERDARRRERRQKAQEARAARRLERHAAQGSEPGPSKPKDRPRTPKTDRSQRRRQDASGLGLAGVDAEPSRPRSSRRKNKSPSSNRRDSPVKETQDLSQRDPFADPESEVTTPLEDPVINTAAAVRYSLASSSPPTSPTQHTRDISNISQITDLQSGNRAETKEANNQTDERRTSEISTTSKRTGPLASLFRRSAPSGRKGSGVPPSEQSFSNTSRESMGRQGPPAHLREMPSATLVRSGTSGGRTTSKFREDLPEFSTSAPDSRVQSPVGGEASVAGSVLSERQREKMPAGRVSADVAKSRELRAASMGSTAAPSAAVLSQSLASVDSEGSWLSGRPTKRTSLQQMSPGRGERMSGQSGGSGENVEEGEGSMFERTTLGQTGGGASGIRAGLVGRGALDDAANPEKVGGDEPITTGNVSRRPTIVHHEDRAKSSEGLLRQFDETEGSPVEGTHGDGIGLETPGSASPTEAVESPSGKPSIALAHTRSISRGSATLLDIPAKSSARSSQVHTPPATD